MMVGKKFRYKMLQNGLFKVNIPLLETIGF
jgi:hypothetical protein